MSITAKNGRIVASFPVEESDQIMLVTDGGKLIRTPVTGIRIGAVTIWMGRLDDRRQRRLLGLLAALWHRLALDGEGKPDPARLDAADLEAWQMAGGKRVVAGKAYAFGELERFRNDPKGYADKVNAELQQVAS